MKAKHDQWQRFTDRIRNAIYPFVPLVVVAMVWTIGWARSVESNAMTNRTPILPLDSEGRLVTRNGPMNLSTASETQPPYVASLADPD